MSKAGVGRNSKIYVMNKMLTRSRDVLGFFLAMGNPLWLILIPLLWASCVEGRYSIGVNYGQVANNLPSPSETVKLMKQLRISKVKIYDANSSILRSLAKTEIGVTIMVTNQEIPAVGASQSIADEWVNHNISRYYPDTKIVMVLVGNEILSDFSIQQTWPLLVPAMRNIHKALKKQNLQHKIKVSTPHALDVLEGSSVFPPSNGMFRSDISNAIMEPMLEFLSSSRSKFFIDSYPFFTWQANRAGISLELALFNGTRNEQYVDTGNGLVYDNLLYMQLDSIAAAMSRIRERYDEVGIVVSETGWPTAGGIDQRGANVYNAALYNRRLVRKILKKPADGTPRRPGRAIPTFLFALFNENLKPGPVTERNWGLFKVSTNGSTISRSYPIDLLGRLDGEQYEPLQPPPPEPLPGTQKLWCVVDVAARNVSAEEDKLAASVAYACGQGGANCSSIAPGGSCFLPNTNSSHASFAFNDYYFKQRANGATCNFDGAATLTDIDPGYDSCKYSPTII